MTTISTTTAYTPSPTTRAIPTAVPPISATTLYSDAANADSHAAAAGSVPADRGPQRPVLDHRRHASNNPHRLPHLGAWKVGILAQHRHCCCFWIIILAMQPFSVDHRLEVGAAVVRQQQGMADLVIDRILELGR